MSFLRHPCHPNPMLQFIHSATSQKSHDLSQHYHQYQSNLQYLQFCNNLIDGQTAEKVCPTYPPIYTATALPHPSNSQWTQICDFQTRTRTRNPGLTFPKPENPGLQKEPGFGNSSVNFSRDIVMLLCNNTRISTYDDNILWLVSVNKHNELITTATRWSEGADN